MASSHWQIHASTCVRRFHDMRFKIRKQSPFLKLSCLTLISAQVNCLGHRRHSSRILACVTTKPATNIRTAKRRSGILYQMDNKRTNISCDLKLLYLIDSLFVIWLIIQCKWKKFGPKVHSIMNVFIRMSTELHFTFLLHLWWKSFVWWTRLIYPSLHKHQLTKST